MAKERKADNNTKEQEQYGLANHIRYVDVDRTIYNDSSRCRKPKNSRFDPSPLRLIHGYGREVHTLYYYQEWVVLVILSIRTTFSQAHNIQSL